MYLHYWAGSITPEIICEHGNPLYWATDWLSRAFEAEKNGNELVIFEIPKNDLVYGLAGLEMFQPPRHPMQSPGVDPMPFDLSFYKELTGEI